jgi:hypothetical protein
MYGKTHLEDMLLCMVTFELEYNEEWKDAFEKLEEWIVQNDAMLETTKPGGSQLANPP